MAAFYITTSWDDGHILDRRVADLLSQHGLTGTFYIARDYLSASERLTDTEIAQLSTTHETGAHTLTHPVLTEIPLDQARSEITGSRQWLADVTGSDVTSFCYPKGAFNPALRDAVAEAGYTAARTVEAYRVDAGSDPLAVPTTVQVYPFPLRPSSSIRARFMPLRRAWAQRSTLKLPLTSLRSWPALATTLLECAAATGGVWHLWGHSWEVDRNGMWDDLERVLTTASRYRQTHDAQPVTNTALVRAMWGEHQ